jgi:tryptophan halogenase
VIVGGGAAGWLAAAALARVLKPGSCDVRLIESRRATDRTLHEVALPSFHRLNGLLGIDESDLLRRTRGTFTLGTQFRDWGAGDEQYFHTFGVIGAKLDAVPFHHYWLKLRPWSEGSIEDYSASSVAARQGRFALPTMERTSFLSSYSYGYHFHAQLLAAYLREYAEAHGVTCCDREVVEVLLRSEDGFVDQLQMDDGSRISADLYIDCVGPQGILFNRTLREGYQDWSQWLPCDRAVNVLHASDCEPVPFATAAAGSCGWSWRVPLHGSVSFGQVYSSQFSSDEAAVAQLPAAPEATPGEPRRWSAGRPARFWSAIACRWPGVSSPWSQPLCTWCRPASRAC